MRAWRSRIFGSNTEVYSHTNGKSFNIIGVSNYPTYRMFGEQAVLLDWPAKIDLDIHSQVLFYAGFISENFTEEIIETVMAYHSLVVY